MEANQNEESHQELKNTNPKNENEITLQQIEENPKKYTSDFLSYANYPEKIGTLSENLHFEIDLNDIFEYNTSLYEYIINNPIEAINSFLESIKIKHNTFDLVDPVEYENVKIIFIVNENALLPNSFQRINQVFSKLYIAKGHIIHILPYQTNYKKIKFECNLCHNCFDIEQDENFLSLKKPSACPSKGCKNTKNFTIFSQSKVELTQHGFIQIDNDDFFNIPVKFILKDTFVNEFQIGDHVLFFAILLNEPESLEMKINKFHPLLSMNNILILPEDKKNKLVISYIHGAKYGEIYQLRSNGIYRICIITNKNDDLIGINTTPIWVWDNFLITHMFKSDENNNAEPKYNISLNGDLYHMITFKKFVEKIKDSLYTGNLKRDSIAIFFKNYVDFLGIQPIEFRAICGLTREGLIMPGDFSIDTPTGVSELLVAEIEKMWKLDIDENIAKENMKKLYNYIDLEYKGIMIAMSVVMPFTDALKSITKLQPWMALGGRKGGTGRSLITTILTKKIWNSMDREIFDKKSLDSASKFVDVFSCHTFPIGIDDCQDLETPILSTMKAKSTNDTKNLIKNTDQSIKSNKKMSAPEIFNFNEPPELFNDPQYLERGLYIELLVPKQRSDEKVQELILFIDQLIPGYFGKHILNTYLNKIKTFENLVNMYMQCPIISQNAICVRKNTIFRLIHLGAKIFELAFDFELNLDGLKYLIDETPAIGSEKLFELMYEQIMAKWDAIDAERYVCKVSWVKNPVYAKLQYPKGKSDLLKDDKNNITHYYYRTTNLDDLCHTLNLPTKSWTLNRLLAVIQARVPEAYSESVFFSKNYAAQNNMIFFEQDKSSRAIVIPANKIDLLIPMEKSKRDILTYLRRIPNIENLNPNDEDLLNQLELDLDDNNFQANKDSYIKIIKEFKERKLI